VLQIARTHAKHANPPEEKNDHKKKREKRKKKEQREEKEDLPASTMATLTYFRFNIKKKKAEPSKNLARFIEKLEISILIHVLLH
jgi:hypothetical protein